MNEQRVLICGFGFMGEMHAQAYRAIPLARVVGFVDLELEAARQKGLKLGFQVPFYRELEEGIDDSRPDIVDICLPTDLHAKAAVAAFARGKHVFCEKPVALTEGNAKQMLRARDGAGTFCQVGQCIRFWPEYQAFERFVRKGEAGRLRSLTLQRRAGRPVTSSANWMADPARSSGAALDLHIHDTDYLLHLFGAPPAVFSRGTLDAGGWSHISTHYLYPDIVAYAEGGWDYPPTWGFRMAFQAVFERGAVEYDSGASPTLRVTLDGRAPEALPFVAAGGTAQTTGNVSSLGGYANELEYFIGRVAAGRAPEVATLEQATQSLVVTLAEMESASRGAAVAIRGGTP